MVLKNTNSGVMSAEETLPSRPSVSKRDQKSSVQDSDDNSSNRRAYHSSDTLCLHSDIEDNDASCRTGTTNNFGRGVEAADGVIEGLGYDSEDRSLESEKHSRPLEVSRLELKLSSSDNCYDRDEKVFKSNKRDESYQIHAPAVSTFPESDVEEEDVKVCDICGDAGREDLLAVCSRCSDGAEHTYCMREMLDKVPEGDWLCEECKCNELLEAQKDDHSKKLVCQEKIKSLGRTNSVLTDPSLKLDKVPFCERPKLQNFSLNRQASFKRPGERMESCPTAKKQALESTVGSPMASSPSRKGKTNNQSIGAEFMGDCVEYPHSPTTNSRPVLKGDFLKSNSFSSSNSKQNLKVPEDTLQKQADDAKDGLGKVIGKSMSFKGLGRPSSSEPRVKMLPVKCAPVQDLKGQKHGRDHTLFERKNMIKLDHSVSGHTKRSSRGNDNDSTLSVTNTRDYKIAQTDGKLPSMSKHVGHLDKKPSDVMMNIGIVGSVSLSATSSAFETKLIHSPTADRSLNIDGARAYGQDSQSEKAPENFSSRSRQCSNSGVVSGSRSRLPPDASALKNKEGLHEDNKLKAAIEAAMQKKQDIFRKKNIPVKPSEFPISSTQRCHGEETVSSYMHEKALHEGHMDPHDIILNSFKQMHNSGVKQIKLYSADFKKSPIGESVLTVSAVPEQETVWQGGFEIHRNGKLPDICCGFQAHMSIFASGKVLDVVGKLPQKIIFNEVPRPCAWPLQFKELGAREDNIALYFFAKDTESYTRSYKILVDYMMKHDLALRGNINGVELLVFPSNHLPHKSKCWNTLYFIWGVFRGKRLRLPNNSFGSLGKCEISISDTAVPVKDVISAENPWLHKLAADQVSISDSGHNFVSGCEAPGGASSSLQQCTSLSNEYCHKEECSVDATCVNSSIGTGNHEKHSFGEACPESEIAVLRDPCQQNPHRFLKHQKSTRDLNRGKNLPSELMLDKQDTSLPSKLTLAGKEMGDTVISSVNSERLDTGSDCINNVKFKKSMKQEEQYLENMHKSGQMNLENDIDKKEDMNYLLKNEAKLKSQGDLRPDNVDINVSADIVAHNLHRLHSHDSNGNRYSHEDSIEAISLAAATVKCHKRPWVDIFDMSEDAHQASCSKSTGDRLDAQMGGVSSRSHKAETFYEHGNEKPTATNPASAKGGFLLVDSQPVHNIQPREVALSENDECLLGGSPNLELALGVKKKQLSFFADVVNRKDPDRPPDVVASLMEDNGMASASLSLSLGFPFPGHKA